jgi:hypothetical protein
VKQEKPRQRGIRTFAAFGGAASKANDIIELRESGEQ